MKIIDRVRQSCMSLLHHLDAARYDHMLDEQDALEEQNKWTELCFKIACAEDWDFIQGKKRYKPQRVFQNLDSRWAAWFSLPGEVNALRIDRVNDGYGDIAYGKDIPSSAKALVDRYMEVKNYGSLEELNFRLAVILESEIEHKIEHHRMKGAFKVRGRRYA